VRRWYLRHAIVPRPSPEPTACPGARTTGSPPSP
jgi:hypothetical protein